MYVPISAICLLTEIHHIGLSTKQLSEESGVSHRTIRRLISGNHDVARLSTANKLCKALGINLTRIKKSYSNRDIIKLFGSDDIPF